MSDRILLICNDESDGRAVSQACRVRGIAVPGWCVPVSGNSAQPGMDANGYVVVHEPSRPVDRDWEMARLIAAGSRMPSVVFAGEPGRVQSGGIRIVEHSDGWPDRVADQVIDLLGLTPVLLPNYENRLRVLGRVLDRRGYRSVSISESSDDLYVRPEPPDDMDLPPFSFTARDFGRLARESLTSRGEPGWERPRGHLATMGHERLLRYLGQDLDRRGAERIRVLALARSLVVSGHQAVSPYDPAEPFQEMYRESQLRSLLQQTDSNRRKSDGWMDRLSRRLGIR